MTLVEFSALNENSMIRLVSEKGVFLQHHISKTEMICCYAIELFFVELVYDANTNRLTEIRSFISGKSLDKYAPTLKLVY